MPLRDHFHPPYHDLPPWSSVATSWAMSLTRRLNRTLPRDEFVAYPTIHLGTQVEADVAEYDKRKTGNGDNGGVATLPTAPPALLTLQVTFPDDIEIRVGTSRHEWNLCGVIELVSESNKKEADARQAFVTKCASYIQRGIGVVVIDVVTNRHANLHNQLLELIGDPDSPRLPASPPSYVVGYRPIHREDRNELDIWPYLAPVGTSLPAVPFALRTGPTLVLDLETTYMEAISDLGMS